MKNQKAISIMYKFIAVITVLILFVSCVLIFFANNYFARTIHETTNRYAL